MSLRHPVAATAGILADEWNFSKVSAIDILIIGKEKLY